MSDLTNSSVRLVTTMFEIIQALRLSIWLVLLSFITKKSASPEWNDRDAVITHLPQDSATAECLRLCSDTYKVICWNKIA